jgi:hypothetical protein
VTHFVKEAVVKEDSGSSGPAAEGSGTPLGDIDYVKEAIDKKKADDDTLKQLHVICYSGQGQNTKRKKSLRAFNGFADDDVKSQKVRTNRNTIAITNTHARAGLDQSLRLRDPPNPCDCLSRRRTHPSTSSPSPHSLTHSPPSSRPACLPACLTD